MYPHPRLLPLLAGLLLLPLGATASVMIEASVEELSREADLVVRGTVQRTEGRRSGDGAKIFTVVTLKVVEGWKGTPAETVELLVPGGSFGGFGQMVQGAPRFAEGEEVVVFLQLQAPGAVTARYRVAGMAQGKLSIAASADQPGLEIATLDRSGLELTPRRGVEAVRAPTLRLPVPELKARVLAALR